MRTPKGHKYYLTKDVEKMLSITRRTLFNYEKQGKIKINRDDISGYRIYNKTDIIKIKSILKEGGEK